jgi:hypothetical protein
MSNDIQIKGDGIPDVAGGDHSITSLLPIMAAVFTVYLVIGLAMPPLPPHVQSGKGRHR